MDMAGRSGKLSEVKIERIRKLTKEGLTPSIIAQRLNIGLSPVYYYQKKYGINSGRRE